MRPNKGVDMLIHAAELLVEHRDFHFLLIGELLDPKISVLAKKLSIADRLHFTGWRKDASALVGACDLLVLPTKETEGLPKAVIEAMAQGIAPVATAVGGVPELICDGVNGLLVAPGSPDAIAGAVLRLAENDSLRQALGAAARESIRQSFPVEKTVAETLDLYRAFWNTRESKRANAW
jgi:glycosyltransferase involved in cell wall biosynthesis